MEIETEVDLGPMTTYKLGGSARHFALVESVDDILELVPADGPVLVLGRGSNLLVADSGFDGLVIKLGRGVSSIRIDDGEVIAGGGASLAAVARACAKADRGGLEWLVGVPGSVGGAVRMNAGCFGSDVADMLVSCVVVDMRTGLVSERMPESLAMSYRTTNLAADELVISATFSTNPSTQFDAEARMREVTRWRKTHQPGGTFNAGSVFKNPVGDAAGRIIDSLGLKGTRVGGVSVSERHANFFVADESATAQDMFDLVQVIQSEVLSHTGVELIPEVVFVGFD